MPDDLPPDAVPIRMLGPDDTGSGSVDPGTVDPGTVDPDTVDHQILDPGAGGGGPSGRVVIALVAVLAVLIGVAGVLVYQRATTPGADSVDVGFMQDMGYHHDQATELSIILLDKDVDPDLKAFAQEIRESDAARFVQWKDPAMHSLSQVADAATKDRAVGMSLRTVLERRYGFTEPEIEQELQRVAAEATDPTLDRIAQGLLNVGDTAALGG